MRRKRVVLTIGGVAAVGLCLAGARIVAHAQNGDAGAGKEGASGVPAPPPKTDAAPRAGTAEQSRLRAELDGLLRQRDDLDRKIADLRGKLGEQSSIHRRFEFSKGDGKPQVFEFDGASMPPEARKQMEEARKRLRDAMGNLDFGDLPMLEIEPGAGFGAPDSQAMKSFQERMKRWQQQFQERMQRRFKNGQAAPDGQDGADPAPNKKPTSHYKTLDA